MASLIGLARVKYWELIADNLSKAGWSWGCVSAVDSNVRTIFIADAHCDDGKRFVVRADEKLTALVELESVIRENGKPSKTANSFARCGLTMLSGTLAANDHRESAIVKSERQAGCGRRV